MNQALILDHLRRRGIWIGIISLAHLALCIGQILSPRHTLATPILLLFAGPVFLSMDLGKGLARAQMLLPIDRKTIARTWWGIGVGLPTVLSIVLFLLAAALAPIWSSEASGSQAASALPRLLVNTILVFSTLSISFFALTGLPVNAEEAKKWSGKSGFFGALWGLSIGGSMLLANFLREDSSQIVENSACILATGLGFSIWGYARTENMLAARSTGRPLEQNKPGRLDKPLFEINTRTTGFSQLTQTTIAHVLGFGIFFLVSVIAIQWLLLDAWSPTGSGRGIDRTRHILEGQAAIFMAMPLFFTASKLTAARVFRTLPLTAKQLSNQLFRLVAILLIIQSSCAGLLAFIAAGGHESVRLFCFYFFIGGIASFSIPVVLRWGFRPLTFALLMPIFGISPLVNLWIPEAAQPLLLISLALGFGFLAKYLTERVFVTSSEAYRNIHQNWMNPSIYGRG